LIARTRDAGFAAEEIPFDSLFAPARADAGSSPYALLVVNNGGSVMFRSGHPEMRLNNLTTRGAACAGCHQSLDHVDRMMAMDRGLLQYSVREVPQLAAVAPVAFEGERWTAAAIAPAAIAVSLLTSEVQQFGLLAVATLVCCAVTVHMTWRERQRRHRAAAEESRRVHLERSHSALTALNSQLEYAAEEWRRTVDTIDAAIVVLDPSGSVERMNRVASDLLPGAAFSWLRQPSAALASIPPWDSALALAGEALERDGVATARVRIPRTGQTWDLWCRAPKRRDHRSSVVVVARDVTALVELQASLRRSETMAALGLVVAGVAHEVRNPLFAISSLVDAWALQPQTAPARLISALRGEVARLKTLMSELLEYGSSSAPELGLASLKPVVEEAVNACRHDFEARGVRADIQVPPDLQLWMDPRRLRRVFLNLLQNGAQHAPAGTAVTLVATPASADSSFVEIEVCDDGPGFAAEDIPRLFTPFFSRRAGGFGLGLAISERIVGEHGGQLSATNRPGGGARMTVSLPVRVASGIASFS
jgi:signal transduction histidine kinase